MQTKKTFTASNLLNSNRNLGKTMKRTWLFLLLFACVLPAVHGQTFVREYGRDDVNEGGGVLLPDNQANSTNFYLAGYQGDSTVIMFMDQDGAPIWTRRFKVSVVGFSDRILDLKFDLDGTMIGCGFGQGANTNRGFVFRYDPVNDIMQWMSNSRQNTIAREVFDRGRGEPLTVIGSFTAGPVLGNDAQRFQVNRNTGAILGINESFSVGSSEDFVAGVVANGNLYATGRFNGANGGTNRMRSSITQLNAAGGASVWTNLYLINQATNARLYSSDMLVSGGDVLRVASNGDLGPGNGTAGGTSAIVTTIHTYTTGLGGNLLTSQGYNIADYTNEVTRDIIENDNTFYILGDQGAGALAGEARDFFIINIAANNGLIWARGFGDTGVEGFYSNPQSQIMAHNGTLYFTGQVMATGATTTDMVLYRINLDGTFDDDCPLSTELEVNLINAGNAAVGFNPTFGGGHVLRLRNENPEDFILPDTIPCGDNFECYIADDPNYQQITGSVVINSDQAFTGKYYVAAGALIVVDGATLDLTNVDMVFENCAGIDFINEASIRANNSVFRTCNPEDSWRGFRFEGDVSGVINECTFKNALQAVASEPVNTADSDFDVRITNNLFANNHTGIDLERALAGEAISGNTFVVEEAGINYAGPCTNGLANDLFGIRADLSQFASPVTQNDFSYGDSDQSLRFHGVAASFSRLTVSLSSFTNLFEAVEMTSCNSSSIENNEIEVTRSFEHHENQIRLDRSQYVGVTGNVLNKYDERSQLNFNEGAIYGESCSYLNIKENEINGFLVGIQSESSSWVGINDNVLINSNLYGIYAHNGNDVDLSCNQIRMRQDLSLSVTGMAYVLDNSNSGNRISLRNNCISDGHTALALDNSIPGRSIPQVVNNYFYNYTDFGVINNGFSGNIGNSGSSFAQAGRNTFRSNNIPNGANDVHSVSTTMVAGGNFGISSTNANVSTNGNNSFHSTAACGHQIESVNNQQITGDEVCDNYSENLSKTQSQLLQGEGYTAWLQAVVPADRMQQAAAWMGRLHRTDVSAAAQLKDFLVGSDLLQAFNQQRIAFLWHRLEGETQESFSVLASLLANDPDQADWIDLETLLLNLEISGRSLEELDVAERALLLGIIDHKGKWAKTARELMQASRGNHSYVFEPVKLFAFEKSGQRMVLDEEFLTVYPNPANASINIQYFLQNAEGGSLRLYDLNGRMLRNQSIADNAAERNWNINDLPAGVYILSLSNATGRISQTKLIKY